MRRLPRFAAAALIATLARQASAEGTAELGVQSKMTNATIMGVDIINPAVETITWTGTGSVTVTNPSGASLGSFSSGQTITPTPGLAGAYLVKPTNSQTGAWDIAVNNPVKPGGRLFSTRWRFSTGT